MRRERLESCRYGMRVVDPLGTAGGEATDCCKNRQAAGKFDRIEGFLDISSHHDANTAPGVAFRLPSESFCTTCSYYVNKKKRKEDSESAFPSDVAAARRLLAIVDTRGEGKPDFQAVIEFIDTQPNLIKIRNVNGWTLLHFAAWEGP